MVARQSATHAGAIRRYSTHLLCAATLAVITVALYLPTLSAGYVYEDRPEPAFAEHWGGFRAEVSLLVHHPTRTASRWSFIATGRRSHADRTLNLSLHLFNTGLLVLVVLPTLGAVTAFGAAALFALHPVQAEAVAYVSSRPDLLVGTGILIALIGVTYGQAWLMLCGAGLAALSKETGVMALPLALAWAWQTGRPFPSRRALLSTGAIVGLLTGGIAWQFGVGVIAGPDEVSAHLGMLSRLLTLVAWPAGLTMDHSWVWLTPRIAALGTIAWLMVLWAAAVYPRSWLAFGLLWALLALLPRLLAHDAEPLHEHHLYGPMLGLSVGVTAWVMARWWVVAGTLGYYARVAKCAIVGHSWLAPDRHWCMRCQRNEILEYGGWIARQVWMMKAKASAMPDLKRERDARYARFTEETHAHG